MICVSASGEVKRQHKSHKKQNKAKNYSEEIGKLRMLWKHNIALVFQPIFSDATEQMQFLEPGGILMLVNVGTFVLFCKIQFHSQKDKWPTWQVGLRTFLMTIALKKKF